MIHFRSTFKPLLGKFLSNFSPFSFNLGALAFDKNCRSYPDFTTNYTKSILRINFEVHLCQQFSFARVCQIQNNSRQNSGHMFAIHPGAIVSSAMIDNNGNQRLNTRKVFTTFHNSFHARISRLVINRNGIIPSFGIFHFFSPSNLVLFAIRGVLNGD